MHQSSRDMMASFVSDLPLSHRRFVLDIGSRDVKGSYRDLFSEGTAYCGLDMEPGENVDYVPPDPYNWIAIEDGSFDTVISGQAFEHIEYDYLTAAEMYRVLRPGGLCCVIAPSAGPKHDHPNDYRRYTIASLSGLFERVGFTVISSKRHPDGPWNDIQVVLAKRSKGITVVIPVIREENIEPLKKMILENSGLPEEQIEILIEVDIDRVGCPMMVKKLVERAKHNWICFLGDDTRPQKKFLFHALEAGFGLPGSWGVVGLNDLTGRTLNCHWLAHKKMLQYTDGEFFSTEYEHNYCDVELQDIAKEMGRYTYCLEAVVEHDHPAAIRIKRGLGREVCITKEEKLKCVRAEAQNMRDLATYEKRLIHRRTVWPRKKKVGIAFPITDETVPRHFFESYLGLKLDGVSTVLLPTFRHSEGYRDIADVRNNLVKQAYNEGLTHIIFADTDQIYPPETIQRLLNMNTFIAGGVVHRRWAPYDPVVLRKGPRGSEGVPAEEVYSGGIIPADATGTGILCIDMTVFDILGPDAFEIINDGRGVVGEDILLCHRARAKGFSIYIDTSIQVGHMGIAVVDKNYALLYKKLAELRNMEGQEND